MASVNVAVSGRFHFHNYVRLLGDRGQLNRFYYSHKFATDAKALGIEPTQAVNGWLKEYLLHGHDRVTMGWGLETMKPVYRALWAAQALRHWASSDLLHVMLHGGGLRLIERARRDGALVLGEPVNAHPIVQNRLVQEERGRLGLPGRSSLSRAQRRLLEEASRSDHLLVASDFIRRTYVEEGFEDSCIHVIPYGVDLSRFFPPSNIELAQHDGRFRVICVAGINIRKGHADLLEAWRLARLPDAELVLVGGLSPEMRPLLKRYSGSFLHVPRLHQDALRDWYGASHVSVLPSIEDGFGVVCSESMACGVPVITTRNAGAGEVIEHGVDGFVVPARSPESIAECLVRLHADSMLLRRMSSAAHLKASGSMTWDRYVEELTALYQRILGHAGSAPLADPAAIYRGAR